MISVFNIFFKSFVIRSFCFGVYLFFVYFKMVNVIYLDFIYVILLVMFRDFRLCYLLRSVMEFFKEGYDNRFM